MAKPTTSSRRLPELERRAAVLIVSNSDRGQEREPATIVKVGRTLYHVRPGRYDYHGLREVDRRVKKFSIATRRSVEAGGSAGYGVWLRTPVEVEEEDRRAAAQKLLRECGLEFQLGRSTTDWTTQALEELAATARRLAPCR